MFKCMEEPTKKATVIDMKLNFHCNNKTYVFGYVMSLLVFR